MQTKIGFEAAALKLSIPKCFPNPMPEEPSALTGIRTIVILTHSVRLEVYRTTLPRVRPTASLVVPFGGCARGS